MDGDRRYGGESEGWFGDQAGSGRVPGQRNGQHHSEADPRYGYGEQDTEPGGSAYGDDTGNLTGEHGRRRRTGPVRNTRRGAPDSGADQAFADPAYADQAYGSPGYAGGGYGESAYTEYGAAPTQTDTEDPRRRRAEVLDRDALRRDDPPYAPGMEAPVSAIGAPTQAMPAGATSGTAVYTSRRPGLGMLIGIVAVVAEVILLVVLAHGLFKHGLDVPAILSGLFGLAGPPLTAIGLYALVCGAAGTDPVHPGRVWLRTPLAYLPVGLALLLAAGAAG